MAATLLSVSAAGAADPGAGECAGAGGDGPSRCLYRSLLPSAGIVAVCETDTRCRVGAYHGPPETPTWFAPPAGRAMLPRPTVRWHSATLGEARFDVGPAGTLSYFFEARRQRISGARAAVLEVDVRRSLYAAAEERALVVRQIFSGRPVTRIERPWAPGLDVRAAVTGLRFDPDGRLSFTWLAGSEHRTVSERVSVPSVATPG